MTRRFTVATPLGHAFSFAVVRCGVTWADSVGGVDPAGRSAMRGAGRGRRGRGGGAAPVAGSRCGGRLGDHVATVSQWKSEQRSQVQSP